MDKETVVDNARTAMNMLNTDQPVPFDQVADQPGQRPDTKVSANSTQALKHLARASKLSEEASHYAARAANFEMLGYALITGQAQMQDLGLGQQAASQQR